MCASFGSIWPQPGQKEGQEAHVHEAVNGGGDAVVTLMQNRFAAQLPRRTFWERQMEEECRFIFCQRTNNLMPQTRAITPPLLRPTPPNGELSADGGHLIPARRSDGPPVGLERRMLTEGSRVFPSPLAITQKEEKCLLCSGRHGNQPTLVPSAAANGRRPRSKSICLLL